MKSSSNNARLDRISCISVPLPSVCLLSGVTSRLECWGCSECLASQGSVPCWWLWQMSAPPRVVRAARSPTLLLSPSPHFPASSPWPWPPKWQSSSESTSPRNGLKSWTEPVAVCVMPAQPPTAWAQRESLRSPYLGIFSWRKWWGLACVQSVCEHRAVTSCISGAVGVRTAQARLRVAVQCTHKETCWGWALLFQPFFETCRPCLNIVLL